MISSSDWNQIMLKSISSSVQFISQIWGRGFISYPLLVKYLPQIFPWITSRGRALFFSFVCSSFRNLQIPSGEVNVQKALTSLWNFGVTPVNKGLLRGVAKTFSVPTQGSGSNTTLPTAVGPGGGLGCHPWAVWGCSWHDSQGSFPGLSHIRAGLQLWQAGPEEEPREGAEEKAQGRKSDWFALG